MVAFLRLEKLRRPDSPAAVALAVVATLVALVAAPLLNRDTPWFDYETWAAETSSSKSTSFTLGRTELRRAELAARRPRAAARARPGSPPTGRPRTSTSSTASVWLRSQVAVRVDELPHDNPRRIKRWTQQIKVSIRNLRTRPVHHRGLRVATSRSRGWSTSRRSTGCTSPPRTLRRGDAYTATVYTPQADRDPAPPRGRRLRPPTWPTTRRSTPQLAGAPGRAACGMTFPFFGTDGRRDPHRPRDGSRPAEDVARARRHDPDLRSSRATLRDGRADARRVRPARARLLRRRATFTYSEVAAEGVARPSTASSSTPSRATASSTPARWRCCCGWRASPRASSTGFSHRRDGPQDRRVRRARLRRALLGRGLLPGLGLAHVRPDARRLARAQPARRRASAPRAASAAAARRNFGGDPVSERGAGVAAAAEPAPWWRIPAIVAGAARRSSGSASSACAAGAAARRRRCPSSSARSGARAANRRPGRRCTRSSCASPARPPRPGYVRALRESRYRDEPGHPTRAQRRGLRSELGRGGGMLGRIRAWWALPPTVAAGLQLVGWTMSMTSISEEWRCWRTGTSTRRRSRWPRPVTSSPTRPRSARPSAGRTSAPAASRRRARSSRRSWNARPTNDYALFCLGRALMQLGRTAEARKPLTLAANMNPKRRDYRIYRDRARKAA